MEKQNEIRIHNCPILVLLFLSGCSRKFKLPEKQWHEIEYSEKGNNGETVNAKVKVQVTRSEYYKSSSIIGIQVHFKFINMDKIPNSFMWQNTYVENSDGLLFGPSSGTESPIIQPLVETNELYAFYEIPIQVNVEKLFWGLYNGDNDKSLKYSIKLEPELE